VCILEIKTKEKIINIAFKLFLENGYEATNIRDICDEVGIKSSTIYFHYKSKQDLFMYIYDETIRDYIEYITSIDVAKKDMPLEEKLYILLRRKLEYYASDLSKRKFILRYHLFPPEEISNVLRDKYMVFTREENKIILDIIESSWDKNVMNIGNINGYLLEYRRLESYLAYEMITSGIKTSEKDIRKMWDIFWNKTVM
jgi:AcrR family transcriptional regulator